jgi:Transglycosylase-like domain
MSRTPYVIRHTGEFVLIALAIALSLLGLASVRNASFAPANNVVSTVHPIYTLLSKQVAVRETSAAHWAHVRHEEHLTYLQDRPAITYTASAVSFSSATVNPNDYSGFQSCVIARESGGNSQVMNATGHYGLYQFALSTWEEYGGSASDFGDASIATQNAVFANAMAHDGESNWSEYDGC